MLKRLFNSRFIRDAQNLVSGAVIAQLIALLISPVLTRLFTPQDFGVFSLLLSAIAITTVFSSLRLDLVIPKVESRLKAINMFQGIVILSIFVAVIALIIIALFKTQISDTTETLKHAESTLFVFPLLIIANGIFLGIRAYSIREGRFDKLGKAQILRACSMAVFWLAIGFVIHQSPPGLILASGHALGQFLFLFYLLCYTSPAESKRLSHFDKSKISAAIQSEQSLISSVAASQLISAIHQRLPMICIAILFDPVFAGYYALAERVVTSPAQMACLAIADVFRQRAAKMHNSQQSFVSLQTKTIMLAAGLAIPVFSAAVFVVPQNIGFLFGSEWQAATSTIAIVLVSSGCAFVSETISGTAVILNAKKYILAWHTFRLLSISSVCLYAFITNAGYETFIILIAICKILAYVIDATTMTQISRSQSYAAKEL